MNKGFSVLYPVKNRPIYNIYNLIKYSSFIKEIIIVDSSDTPLDVRDLVSVFDKEGVEVVYLYKDVSLSMARKVLLQKMTSKYGLWLDSDVVVKEIDFKNTLSLLEKDCSFVGAKVLNSRKLHSKTGLTEYSFLKQFTDDFENAVDERTNIAGMYCLAFKNEFKQYFGDIYRDFLGALSACIPGEDMAFCTFLNLSCKSSGVISAANKVYHVGSTNHAAWSFINFRRVENIFDQISSPDDLFTVMKSLSLPEYVSTLHELYKSS